MIDIFSTEGIGANRWGAALSRARALARGELEQWIERAGLAGKGGAGFPAHAKLRAMREQPGDRKHLVINGSEHEPGSLKDRHLLERYPATVLEGALILADACAATDVWITVNERNTAAVAALETMLRQFEGDAALRHPSAPRAVSVLRVPDVYLVGEETALLEFIEGRAPLPRRRPPFPIQSGLGGAPTLVHNVETVAHLPFLVMQGPDAWRALGRDGKGATLCTFGDEFENAGVQLVPLGISVRELVNRHGGGLRDGRPIKAVQPGGPSAGFLDDSQLDTAFDAAGLVAAGSSLGCAAVRAFAHEADMVAVAAQAADFFAAESCGQCPQCRMQTQTLSAILRQTLRGKGNPRLLKQLPVVIKLNSDKGICGLIRMPVAPVLTALRNFEPEFERHFAGAEARAPAPAP